MKKLTMVGTGAEVRGRKDGMVEAKVDNLYYYKDVAKQLVEDPGMRTAIINALRTVPGPVELDQEVRKLLKELSWELFSKENFRVDFCLERAQVKMSEINKRIREIENE